MYEIPQPLRHQEQIMFGLTAKQLLYAVIGIFPALFLLKSYQSWTGLILAFIPIGISAIFILFDGEKWIKAIYTYLRIRTASFTDNKFKKILVIKEIKTGVVAVEGKRKQKLAILMVHPLNFNIKTDEDKDVLLLQFQRFLNALDFSIQIIMTTRNMNMNGYLKQINKKNTAYPEQKQEYIKHLTKLSTETELRNRHFYIVIPDVNDSLDIQINIVTEMLNGMGLMARKLNTGEITELYQHYFQSKNHSIIIKDKDAFHASIAPKEVNHTYNTIKINDVQNRILYASGYPRTVIAGFLDKIICSEGNFDLSLFIEPYRYEDTLVYLNNELQKQNADLYGEKIKGILNPSLEIQFSDTRSVLETLQKGDSKLFNVSLYINCKANDEKKLNLLTKKVESTLNSILIQPKQAILRMTEAYLSMLPVAINYLDEKRNITTKGLSAFFPFTSQFLTLEKTGILFGKNKNKAPVVRDIFKLANHNGIVLSSSGSGKSFFSKLFIARQLINGCKVMVIDPQNEYVELAKRFNGQIVNISRDSETIINPLDVMGHDYAEKRLALLDLCKIMFGDLTEIQRAILDRAFSEAYSRKGFNLTQNGEIMPTLSDVEIVLESMAKHATSYEKPTYRAILNRLNMFTKGAFSFLNKQTNLDFNNDFVCFTIGDMPKQVKPIIMFLILDYVYMKMKQDKSRKLLIVDEAWSLLSRAEEASYLFEIVKTCRKFNMGLLLITQDVEDLLGSKAGHAVLANSAYSLLLRQKPAVMAQMSKVFNLSDREKMHLLSASIGKGLLIMENDHTELDIIASDWEYGMAITNTALPQPKPVPTVKQNTQLDITIPVYCVADMKPEDVNFLQQQGYEASSHVPIGKNRQESFMIRKKGVEGLEHTFLVWNVCEVLKKYTDKIETFETVKPDVVFEINGQKWAIEVETGANVEYRKWIRLEEKMNLLRKEFGNHYLFVVGDARFMRYYKKYGAAITRNEIPKFLSLLLRSLTEYK